MQKRKGHKIENSNGIGKVALVSPGQPDTSGGTISIELQRALSRYCTVDHLFVERESICENTDWGENPVKKTPFKYGSIRWWQVHRRMGRYDIYHYMNKRYMRLVRYGRRPAVLTCHGLSALRTGDVYDEKGRRRFRKQFKHIHRMDMVIANSKHTANDLTELLGVPPDKIEVIYFGVNFDVFKPRPSAEARDKLGIAQDALVLLNVGSERKCKNIERMAGVFETLAGEFDNILLVRVGNSYKRYADPWKGMKFADHVIQTGRVHDPALYYNAADVYLCLDLHASFAIPNLEAMASGCPVVTSNVEAIPEIVADACCLVDPRSTQKIVGELRRVLDDENLRSELRERGLKRAAQFKWDATARRTMEVYSKVIKKFHARP